MLQNKNYNKTLYACFIGYIIQAIVNNFAPLLFLTFQSSYHIPLSQITLLVPPCFSSFLVSKTGEFSPLSGLPFPFSISSCF